MSEKNSLLHYVQGYGHSIDALIAIFHITQAKQTAHDKEPTIRWKEVKDYLQSQGAPVSDGTYRKKRTELVQLGLIKLRPLDPLKDNVALTEKGRAVALLFIEFVEKLKGVESWQKNK